MNPIAKTAVPYNCPNCDEPTISYWRKQFLGPARSIRCSSCNAKISVSWASGFLSMLLLLVHTVVAFLAGLAAWDMYGILAALIAILLASVPFVALGAFIQHRFAKLVVRGA